MNKIIANLKLKENITYIMLSIFSLLSTLLYFAPYYVTIIQDKRTLVSGYSAFNYLEDTGTSLYYSVSMFIVALALFAILFSFSLFVLISNYQKKLRRFLISSSILVCIIIFEFVGIYYSSKIASGVKCDVYALLTPYISLVILFIHLFLTNKFRENKIDENKKII